MVLSRALEAAQIVDNGADVIWIDGRLENIDHLIDLGGPGAPRERRLVQHHACGVTGQAIVVDRI